jgi:Domain of unknown function (DUF4404)
MTRRHHIMRFAQLGKIMDPNALRDQLTKLHEELRLVSSVDSHSSELLSEIMEDIKRLMPQLPAASSSAASFSPAMPTAGAPFASVPASDSSLSDRLEKIAVQFEVDHPTLAASSRRLVDLLGKVGL